MGVLANRENGKGAFFSHEADAHEQMRSHASALVKTIRLPRGTEHQSSAGGIHGVHYPDAVHGSSIPSLSLLPLSPQCGVTF